MSVGCKRYVGYVMNVLDDLKFMSDENKDTFIYGLNVSVEKINFVSDSKAEKGNITLLYDGLNGGYCKLMYVLACDGGYEEEEPHVQSEINNLLSNLSVDANIITNLHKAYEHIFGRKTTRVVKPEYVIHYY